MQNPNPIYVNQLLRLPAVNACVCSLANSLFCNQHNASSTEVNYTIPAAVDWVSVDMYHMDGPVDNWVRDNVRKFYMDNIVSNSNSQPPGSYPVCTPKAAPSTLCPRRRLNLTLGLPQYPNLTEHQQVLLVPGAFGSDLNRHPNGSYICARDCYDKMCAKDAADFYAWAKSDSRVVGITPWNWEGCKNCKEDKDEIGARDLPATRAAWFRIGDGIKQNSVASRDATNY